MNYKRLNYTLFVTVLAGLFFLASCRIEDSDSVKLTPVTIGVTSYIGEAASFVATEKGFFKENGLDVTTRVNNSGRESINQLFAGEVDIAHVAETPVLYSMMDENYIPVKHGNLQIVANMILANRIQKVIGRRDSGVEFPQDIRGKRVGLAGGTQLEYLLDSFLLEHQIDIMEVDTVHLNIDEQMEAFQNGEIDAAILWEPQATELLNHPDDIAVELPTKLTYSTLWLVTVLDTYIEAHPEIIAAYLRSLLKAQQYIRDNPALSLQLLAERTGVGYEIIHKVISEIDYELTLSERMVNLLKEQKEWMEKSGLSPDIDKPVFDLIEFRFMEEVHPEGITLIR